MATPEQETMLQKNRLLHNNDECKRYKAEQGYTRKIEDINFLDDQRGERKMVLDRRDFSYEQRLLSNHMRKQGV